METITSLAGHSDRLVTQPIARADRIVCLDVLRGFALLGILLMNIQSFAMIETAYINPTVNGGGNAASGWVWYFVHLTAESKFMGIFSMLFGAGIVLMAERCEGRGDSAARLHYRRMAGLLAIGLVHSYLLWSGDILVPYAVCGSLVFLLWRLNAILLATVGVASLMIGGLIYLLIGLAILLAPPKLVAEAVAEDWNPSTQTIESELETFRGPWLNQQRQRTMDSLMMHLIGIPLMFWQLCGLMLLGMALYRVGFLSGQRSSRVYWLLATVSLGVGLAVIAAGVRWNIAHGWRIEYSMVLGRLPNYFGSLLVSIAYIALLVLLFRGPIGKLLTAVLAPVGRTALTNYLAQTLICTTIFYGHGFGLYGMLDRVEQLAVVLCVWVVQIGLSNWWTRRFRFGPVEYLWRRLTYGTLFAAS